MSEGQSIRERIKQVRDDRDLSQRKFAKRIGVSRASVTNWEREEDPTTPTLEAFERICGAFPDVDPGWLLTGRRPMPALQVRESEPPYAGGAAGAERLVTLLSTIPELRYLARKVGSGTIMDALHWTARHFGWAGEDLAPLEDARERIFGGQREPDYPDDPWLQEETPESSDDDRTTGAAENGL